MDLIVRNARLVTNLAAGPVDIGIAGGTIAAIEKGLAAELKSTMPVGGSPAPG